MKQLFFTILITMGLSFNLSANTQSIATVDMEKVYNSYYRTQAVTDTFNRQKEVYKAYAQKLRDEENELKSVYHALLSQAQNISLKDDIRKQKHQTAEAKRAEIKAKKEELTAYNKTKYDELRKQVAKMRQELLSDIKKVVQKIALDRGFQLVLDSSAQTADGLNMVIYSSAFIDLTDSAITKLNNTKE